MTDQHTFHLYTPTSADNHGPRRHLRTFLPALAPLVKSGEKRQTVRQTPKTPIYAGDILDARMWSGKPYRSETVRLIEAPILRVTGIDIFFEEGIALNGHWTDPDAFARADGFETGFAEMCSFFRSQYKDLGDQFTGIAIFW